ncbi:uncharacterized protein BJ212DRAFT_1340304 [Suillus subaureus]|uniref:Uncharacterized protein n=1 Tax=Suillus subaureus TaxID=48587 RepID=A0A9P7EH18_9AGAM|nr:uncharacterized protein BJ212DRAFT_1340304 [Suillus subaureus]KAG1820469.1 hypothetical protein BJ212DRAFT_1340304 [Suillus subaureus]
MITVPSASQWGSPTAGRRAFLIHDLNSSSRTFHRVALALAAKRESSLKLLHSLSANLLSSWTCS